MILLSEENLNNALKQVSSMLQDGDMADTLKSLMDGLNLSAPSPSDDNEDENNGATEKLIRMATKMLNNPNMKSDPKINLLNSLKPYLNKHRKSKVDQCIKFLSMSKAMVFLNENT